MRILVVNDDGILSEGILALANFLAKDNEVVVVAPDGNRSAFSHSLSIFKDIIVKKVEISDKFEAYSMSGTPADCVKFAMHKLNDKKFDLVCSGINKGHNLGSDTVYSGTISAGLEANFFGVPAIAFSNTAHKNCNFESNVDTLDRIFNKLLSMVSSEYTLNVNIPNEREIGVKIAPLGIQFYSDNYVETGDGVYQLVGEPTDYVSSDNCDVAYSRQGYVTITPIKYDRTDKTIIEKFKDVKF